MRYTPFAFFDKTFQGTVSLQLRLPWVFFLSFLAEKGTQSGSRRFVVVLDCFIAGCELVKVDLKLFGDEIYTLCLFWWVSLRCLPSCASLVVGFPRDQYQKWVPIKQWRRCWHTSEQQRRRHRRRRRNRHLRRRCRATLQLGCVCGAAPLPQLDSMEDGYDLSFMSEANVICRNCIKLCMVCILGYPNNCRVFSL